VKILGSMAMRSQQYAGDYDLFEEVQTKGSEAEALRSLANEFQSIVKTLLRTKNIYVGDIKAGAISEWQVLNTNAGIVNGKVENYNAVECRRRIDELARANVISGGEAKYAHSLIKDTMSPEDLIEAKKELKFHIVRWSPNEVLHGSKILRDKKRYTLEEAFSSHALTKLDVIGFIQNNRFTDFSIIYEFFNNGKALNGFPLNVAQSLNEDVIYYKAHGNHFKVLKRMLALAKLNKDSTAVDKLIPILNSDLGRLYLITSDVGTLIELLENERKVPMPLVRFQLDQMKARMGNIYNLPDFLSEEHDLIGDINAILKMTNKAQLLSRLHQIKTKMEDILNSNAKAKGGRRVKGGATRAERALAGEMRAKYFLELGRDPSGRPIRPDIYKLLSAIIHDADPRPIAGDPATQNLSVITDEPGRKPRDPATKQRVRELANFILREEKLTGLPINRAEWTGAEPANPDMLPANLQSLGFKNNPFYFFEDEPVGVWEHFLKSGMATADDVALLPKDATGAPLPFPDFQRGTPSDFRAYFGADYDRLGTVNTPYAPPPPPPTFEERLASEGTPALSPDVSTNPLVDARVAESRARDAQIQQALALMEGEGAGDLDTNPYYLLLTNQLAKVRSVVERFPAQEAQAQAEILSQDEAYQAQLAEEARVAREASERQAREAQERADAEQAQALLEQARLADARETESRAVAEQERATREGVAQAKAEGVAREAQAKARGQPLEERVNKDRLALITNEKDKTEALSLLATLKASRASVKQLAKAKAELLRMELALAKFKADIAERKRSGKKSEGKKADEKLSELETDVELAKGTVKSGEEGVALLENTEAKLEAILAKYPVPLPRREAEQKKGLGELLEGLMGLPRAEAEEEATLKRLPPDIITDRDFAEYFSGINQPEMRGIESEVDEVGDVIRRKAEATTKFAVDETLKLNEAQRKGEITNEKRIEQTKVYIDALSESIREEFLDYFLYDLKTFVVFRNLKEFRDFTAKMIAGEMDRKLGGEAEQMRLGIREGVVRKIGSRNFFNNIMESVKDIDDKTIARMGQIAAFVPRLLKGVYLMEFIQGEGEDEAKSAMVLARRLVQIFRADPEASHSPFWKDKAPVVRRIQDFIKTLSPKARNLLYTSMGYVLHHRGGKGTEDRTLLSAPEEWEKEGKISFPEGLGEARGEGRVRVRRGGKLPRSGVLSDDRATRQQELREMTVKELNDMRDISLADKQIFYALHTEIPIGDVPFHRKGREAVQKLRDSMSRPVAVPQISYGDRDRRLGVREIALQPPNIQYRYYKWIYPWLKPQYLAEQRAKGVSEMAIRFNTREKQYITDWLDTPTPPAVWNTGSADWGVDRRMNPNPPRVAAGRVRGRGMCGSKQIQGQVIPPAVVIREPTAPAPPAQPQLPPLPASIARLNPEEKRILEAIKNKIEVNRAKICKGNIIKILMFDVLSAVPKGFIDADTNQLKPEAKTMIDDYMYRFLLSEPPFTRLTYNGDPEGLWGSFINMLLRRRESVGGRGRVRRLRRETYG
jgi:hypothetical protein